MKFAIKFSASILLAISLVSQLSVVETTPPGWTDGRHIDSHQPSSSSLPNTNSMLPSPEGSVQFLSNEGQLFLIDEETVLAQSLGLLDGKVRQRESMQTSIFVDLSSPLLNSLLNYYRYGMLICPPEEQVPRPICQAALDPYLPGIVNPLDGNNEDAPINTENGEIIISVRTDTSNFCTVAVIYPSSFATWLEPLLPQSEHITYNEPSESDHPVFKRAEYFVGRSTSLPDKIHGTFLFRSPSHLKVSTHTVGSNRIVLHVEKQRA